MNKQVALRLKEEYAQHNIETMIGMVDGKEDDWCVWIIPLGTAIVSESHAARILANKHLFPKPPVTDLPF